MRHRVIREAMKEAHETADRFPDEVWYVLDDDFMSVVKESYFITDDGVRKQKPFVCMYNTKDMRYGRHTVQWIDGEIEIDSKDVKERFKQPYGTKFIDEIPDDITVTDPFDTENKFIVEDTYKELRKLDKAIGYHRGRGTTYVRTAKKIGRNEPCPCDSGKKYKKCCG